MSNVFQEQACVGAINVSEEGLQWPKEETVNSREMVVDFKTDCGGFILSNFRTFRTELRNTLCTLSHNL
jgi:hypothetical protein